LAVRGVALDAADAAVVVRDGADRGAAAAARVRVARIPLVAVGARDARRADSAVALRRGVASVRRLRARRTVGARGRCGTYAAFADRGIVAVVGRRAARRTVGQALTRLAGRRRVLGGRAVDLRRETAVARATRVVVRGRVFVERAGPALPARAHP